MKNKNTMFLYEETILERERERLKKAGRQADQLMTAWMLIYGIAS